MTAAYKDDLAYIHDAGFGFFARNAAPVLLETLRKRGIERGRVIDLGCGSGILSEQVAAAGYDILGIDISPAMIEIARKRVPNGSFRVESVLSADLPSCVAVTAIGEIFSFQFDAGNTKKALSKLLRRIHKALAPNGVLLFDVAGPGRVVGGGPQQRFIEGEDWVVLVTSEEDRGHPVLTRRITSFRKVGQWYRRDDEVHRLRLHSRPAMTAQLRAAGFRVRTLSGYGPFVFPPGLAGYLASRR
jgi:SAM-dependent methyltransferase